MSSSALDLERQTLATLRKDYEARAYRFVERPTGNEVPEFLKDYHPDALAFGEHDRVIIEIKTTQGTPKLKADLAEIGRRLPPNEGWRYVVVYAGQDISEMADLPRSSKSQVDGAIEEARELEESGHTRAAMLQSWSILEALARRLYPHDIRFTVKPLSPAEIVERLAMEGELSADEAGKVRRLRSLRNLLAHGDFETRVAKGDVGFMLGLAERISTSIAE